MSVGLILLLIYSVSAAIVLTELGKLADTGLLVVVVAFCPIFNSMTALMIVLDFLQSMSE